MLNHGPFTSAEVRWFLDGTPSEHATLVEWFRDAEFAPKKPGLPQADWRGRLGGDPDCYLLVPGARDMGIKWREGLLQIKGRVESLGVQAFGGHSGIRERWSKWSYPDLPDAWRELFEETDGAIRSVAVHKQRMLRLLRVDADESILEIDPGTCVRRGINAELTDVRTGGEHFLTLGFEAFPDDAVIAGCFASVVSRVLRSLDAYRLDAAQSHSYPSWLDSLRR